MEFKNRQNWFIEQDGQVHWISRSVTVLPVVLFVLSGDNPKKPGFFRQPQQPDPNLNRNPVSQHRIFVPLGKRGPDLPDEVDKWGLPGGYLDWDETATEAVIRETYEELGLNLLEMRDRCRKFQGDFDRPYHVRSVPQGKQNVTLWFALMFWVDSLPELDPKVSSGEVQEAKWFDLPTVLQMNLAFNHQNIIRDCLHQQFDWTT
jgi:8-oxo-dGTP diphosphatase